MSVSDSSVLRNALEAVREGMPGLVDPCESPARFLSDLGRGRIRTIPLLGNVMTVRVGRPVGMSAIVDAEVFLWRRVRGKTRVSARYVDSKLIAPSIHKAFKDTVTSVTDNILRILFTFTSTHLGRPRWTLLDLLSATLSLCAALCTWSANTRYMNVSRRKRSIFAMFSSSAGYFCGVDRLLREGKDPWSFAVVVRRHLQSATNGISRLWSSKKKNPASRISMIWGSPSSSMVAPNHRMISSLR